MKRLGNFLSAAAPPAEIVMGNTALVRAMLEAGVRVATSYPGSPTPEIASAILALPKEKNPLYFEFSTNEKVALEVACGAALNGHLSCVFFKSVGLNVAADSFMQLSLLELPGGMLIILGDDPGANSSQNEQDNRHYARQAYLPLFEPASPGEAYQMCKEAAALARLHKSAVVLRLTTHVCHAKEKLLFEAWQPEEEPGQPPRFTASGGEHIPLGSQVFAMKRRALQRLEAYRAYGEASSFVLEEGTASPRGIITAGLPYLSLLDVLEAAGGEKPDILKLGLVHPLPRQRLVSFLQRHQEVKVLEELDDVLEREIKALAYEEGLETRILGKSDLEDWLGEYTPAKTAQVLHKVWPDLAPPPAAAAGEGRMPAPRPPQLCPGCGHRSAFYAVRQALAPLDITVADIGCHTLGYLEPHRMGQVLLSMGHSVATGSGLSLGQRSRRVVAFLGDSTFFHAALPAIVNAVFNQHQLTLILMENGTTAMTGHQDHPGSGRNANGPAPQLTLRRVLEGLGVGNIREVDAYQQAALRQMVGDALGEEGFKVIIARHPCMLKWLREARHSGKKTPRPVRIGPGCTQRRLCLEQFACPSFQRQADGRVRVQEELCIGDGSCRQTCPDKAIESAKGGEKP